MVSLYNQITDSMLDLKLAFSSLLSFPSLLGRRSTRTYTVASYAVGVDDVDKLRLERRATDQETVDIWLLCELLAVGSVDGATVDDARGFRDRGGHGLREERTDIDVRLLGLRGSGDLAGSDSQDGLVGNDDLSMYGEG